LVEVSGETSAMSIATPKVVRGNDTSAGRWVTVTVIVLSTFVAQSFARFTFGLLLPAMKADLGISYGLAGWLGTINLAGYLISTVVTSAASLRFPPHRLVQFGLGLATCGIQRFCA
jgi:predicted MFS family arabinose efflux permease